MQRKLETSTASSEEIKKQYRHVMKVLHPDGGVSAHLFDLVKKCMTRKHKG